MKFDNPYGATPIDLDEADGLLLPHISTRAELDRWEQDNIYEAELWFARKKDTHIIGISFSRKRYIEALQAADSGDYSLLSKFVRS